MFHDFILTKAGHSDNSPFTSFFKRNKGVDDSAFIYSKKRKALSSKPFSLFIKIILS
ncbi:hypothetical protein BSI_14970 [Bacillus inaquosorum KCTC 13429]|uniref:Uncharacterized protein n=1 Tax=Bacillus inaquosorum KCTC 13429 TaxID=1236548 RepID=A0A9W5PDZ7_9BACI|nr:hypothetical protein BSI_14970 [Bacillus inaquosorum KCTC 13429]